MNCGIKETCVTPGCLAVRRKYNPYCSEYHASLDEGQSAAKQRGLYLFDGHWGPPWPAHLKPSIVVGATSDDWILLKKRPPSPNLEELWSVSTIKEDPDAESDKRLSWVETHALTHSNETKLTKSLYETPLSSTPRRAKRRSLSHCSRNSLELETRRGDDKTNASTSRRPYGYNCQNKLRHGEGLVVNTTTGKVEMGQLVITTRKYKQPVQKSIRESFLGGADK